MFSVRLFENQISDAIFVDFLCRLINAIHSLKLWIIQDHKNFKKRIRKYDHLILENAW